MGIVGDGGTLVTAPLCVPSRYGLLSVAEIDDRQAGHWEMGVEYDQSTCEPIFVITACPPADLPEKDTSGGNVTTEFADPFTMVASYKCATGGRPVEEAWTHAGDRLARNEARTLERTFSTGRDVDDNYIRQSLITAEDITPGGTAQDLLEGLSLLEEWAGENYPCSPIIHMDRRTAVIFGTNNTIKEDGPILRVSGTGSRVVVGGGYAMTTGPLSDPEDPDSALVTTGAGNRWLYVTGSIKVLRSPVFYTPDRGDRNAAIKRDTNDIIVFAERTYAIEQDCIVAAIKVSV